MDGPKMNGVEYRGGTGGLEESEYWTLRNISGERAWSGWGFRCFNEERA